jgi:hypothetical protein
MRDRTYEDVAKHENELGSQQERAPPDPRIMEIDKIIRRLPLPLPDRNAMYFGIRQLYEHMRWRQCPDLGSVLDRQISDLLEYEQSLKGKGYTGTVNFCAGVAVQVVIQVAATAVVAYLMAWIA